MGKVTGFSLLTADPRKLIGVKRFRDRTTGTLSEDNEYSLKRKKFP